MCSAMSVNRKREMEDQHEEYLKERIDAMSEKIRDIGDELFSVGQYEPYFSEVRDFLLAFFDAYCLDSNFHVDCQRIKDAQDQMYLPLTEYENTFLNPTYANKRLAAVGGPLSAVYADIVSLPVFAAKKRVETVTVFLELFVELFTTVRFALSDGEDPKEAVCRDIEAFYHDYAQIFLEDACLEPIRQSEDVWVDLIKEADLSLEEYLYAYGFPITESEIKTWSFMNTLSEEEVALMAHTYTNGYVKGFETTRKDISIKSTVAIEYPIGFERMMRIAIADFEKIGFHVTAPMRPMLSVTGRGGRNRGVHAQAINRQFVYDHKDDKGYYYDKAFVNRKHEVMRSVYEQYATSASLYGGPAVVECFGQPSFYPVNKPEAYHYTKKQDALNVVDLSKSGEITNEYIPGSEYSFTIIAFPIPAIGERFEEIFKRTIEINTLDYNLYRDMQERIIEVLDRGTSVRVKGKGENETDITIQLHPLSDPKHQTNFENCVADVNIPVGEVFTSPILSATDGLLHVSYAYLGEYKFENLKIYLKDGMVSDYSCSNFKDETENKKLIFENILFRHETLPIGEFAIGTNTCAYKMAREFHIEEKLPILIAEKCGPHFAFGDTCYAHAEELKMYNPDGKEVVARENECSALRKTDPEKAYFNCHTDITIPYDELDSITVIDAYGNTHAIILDGKFVVEKTEALNEYLR